VFLTPTNDRDVALVDVDDDGWLDIVTAAALSDPAPKHIGHPRIYINKGQDAGTGDWLGFRYEEARIPEVLSHVGNSGFIPRFAAVAAGDVTGDGLPDLCFSDYPLRTRRTGATRGRVLEDPAPSFHYHGRMDPLQAHGYGLHFREAFVALGDAGLEPARVIEEQRGMYRVVTARGERRVEIVGRMRQDGVMPAVGDWVALRPLEEAGGAIEQVLTRRSQIVRKLPGKTTREQVLAANLDTVFMVTSCNEDFSPRRIERYLTMIWESGARPVVVLNKTDLVEDAASLAVEAEAVALGVPVLEVCAKQAGGLDPLASYLEPGKTIALIGSSGVGKSTIVNGLMGSEVQDVRDVLESDATGRHTTRSRQLFLLPGGALLLDTPGLRELALWVTDTGLGRTFADIEELAADCRFQDCLHGGEPGCAVEQAVERGALAADRLASYHKLRRELEHIERKVDPEARAQVKRHWREIHKNMRAGRKKGWFPK
jgi:ribosome biogenesis GTPase